MHVTPARDIRAALERLRVEHAELAADLRKLQSDQALLKLTLAAINTRTLMKGPRQ